MRTLDLGSARVQIPGLCGVGLGHLEERRLLHKVDCQRMLVAGRKCVTLDLVEQVRGSTIHAGQGLTLGAQLRQSLQQSPGIGVPCVVEDLLHGAVLDDLAGVHDGHAVGNARNHAEVHNLYRKSLRLIAVVAVTLTLASMFIIPCVARIFVGYDAELLALTSRAFRLYALSFLIMGFNVYASSFFTALGDGVTSALISFLRTLAFQVIAILLLPLLLGIDGIWLAVTAAELAALAVSAAMLLTKDKVFHYRKA
mgnify:CR=1 FL=1